jgi:hypothetical protein
MRLKSLLFTLWPMVALVGCDGSPTLDWTEDVRLPDGRVVTLKRHQEFKGPHELGDSATPSDNWFEFSLPGTGETVRWESKLKKGAPPIFSGALPVLKPDNHTGLSTIALIIQDGRPMLLVDTVWDASHYLYSCPFPSYLLYQWEQGSNWKLLPLERIPLRKIESNMTSIYSEDRDRIKNANYHLNEKQSRLSKGPVGAPYVLNFDLLPEGQTFKIRNCS